MKVIKNDTEYQSALAAIERLLDMDPDPGTREADDLELLAVLIEEYEQRVTDLQLPDPIEAIRFRMDQQGLKQQDLVPYLGSRSKVSEVLAGKRALSLAMIRSLHDGLRIPAKVLLAERKHDLLQEDASLDWNKFPIREMVNRGWVTARHDLRDAAEEILRGFFDPVGGVMTLWALYRKSPHVRTGRPIDEYALTAWTGRILRKANEDPPEGKYTEGTVDTDLMRDVARFSWSKSGPLLAKEYLAKQGIALVVEPHLPRTHLDGAAVYSSQLQAPVIALTLRHDRIDNFWFCLMHELAHVSLHISEEVRFYDDLDVEELDDRTEREADDLAGEALIPSDAWDGSPASRLRTPEAAVQLAEELSIHPAIVAGRMRHHFKSYKRLSNLVGYGQVRKCFTDVEWK